MNITFLIGNGFDIGVGMKSKFKDFFPIYQSNAQHKEQKIRQLAEAIGDDYETWADFETALGRYTEHFTTETKNIFLDQLKDFQEEFIDYLKQEERRLSFADKEKISDTMVKALRGYRTCLPSLSADNLSQIYQIYRNENTVFNFINFNYTSILEQCLIITQNSLTDASAYPRSNTIGQVVHVHGSSGAYPIIGLNDESQIKNAELAQDPDFSKRMIKPFVSQLLRSNNEAVAADLLKRSPIICAYGMSLGITDKLWWDKIITLLNSNPNRQFVIFEYDEKHNPSTPFDRLNKEDAILGQLERYCADKSIHIEDLRSRIHIAIHKNIFAMNLRKTQDRLEQKALENVLTAI